MNNGTIRIETLETNCMVTAPYNPDFPEQAKNIGGKWNSSQKSWSFDIRDIEQIKKLCISIYGTDGSTDGETVTIRATAQKNIYGERDSIYMYGRKIISSNGRDSGAWVGENVIVLSGKINSGGSVKNWQTIIVEGTVLEIRDLPKTAIDSIDIIDGVRIEILDHNINKNELMIEKENLLNRLKEIESLLN